MKSFIMLFIVIFALAACDEGVVVPSEKEPTIIYIPPPEIDFSTNFFLRAAGIGWYLQGAGDVFNLGHSDIPGLRPRSKFYFSNKAYEEDRPDIVAVGEIGKGGTIYEMIIINRGLKDTLHYLPRDSSLQFYLQTVQFYLSPDVDVIYNRFSFFVDTSRVRGVFPKAEVIYTSTIKVALQKEQR